jgi:rhodanese-related sulfurtransferase
MRHGSGGILDTCMTEQDLSYEGIFMNKMMTFAAVILLGLTASAIGFAAAPVEHSLESVKEDLAAGKAVLLDVREAGEWNDGHLQDARPLPLSQIEKGIGVKQLEACSTSRRRRLTVPRHALARRPQVCNGSSPM